MPQHRKLVVPVLTPARVGEADIVEHERVDDLVRQRILLVQEHPDEQRIRPYIAKG